MGGLGRKLAAAPGAWGGRPLSVAGSPCVHAAACTAPAARAAGAFTVPRAVAGRAVVTADRGFITPPRAVGSVLPAVPSAAPVPPRRPSPPSSAAVSAPPSPAGRLVHHFLFLLVLLLRRVFPVQQQAHQRSHLLNGAEQPLHFAEGVQDAVETAHPVDKRLQLGQVERDAGLAAAEPREIGGRRTVDGSGDRCGDRAGNRSGDRTGNGAAEGTAGGAADSSGDRVGGRPDVVADARIRIAGLRRMAWQPAAQGGPFGVVHGFTPFL